MLNWAVNGVVDETCVIGKRLTIGARDGGKKGLRSWPLWLKEATVRARQSRASRRPARAKLESASG